MLRTTEHSHTSDSLYCRFIAEDEAELGVAAVEGRCSEGAVETCLCLCIGQKEKTQKLELNHPFPSDPQSEGFPLQTGHFKMKMLKCLYQKHTWMKRRS